MPPWPGRKVALGESDWKSVESQLCRDEPIQGVKCNNAVSTINTKTQIH